MSDLISRQAAIDAIERLILPQTKGETAAEEINRVAWRCAINCAEEFIGHLPSAQPTIDAVEVVRCKECKYWNEFIMNRKPQGYGLCTLHEITHKTDTDWFCADGERRDPCSSQDS